MFRVTLRNLSNPGSQLSVVVHVSKVNLTNSDPFGVVVVLGVFGPTGLVLATIVELEVIGSRVFGDGSRSGSWRFVV